MVELAINSAEAAATGESPAFLSFGQQPRLTVDLALDLPPQAPAPAAFAARMQHLVRVTREKLTRAKELWQSMPTAIVAKLNLQLATKFYSIRETFA